MDIPQTLKKSAKQELEVAFEKEVELKVLNKILFKTRIGQHWYQATFQLVITKQGKTWVSSFKRQNQKKIISRLICRTTNQAPKKYDVLVTKA
jgi:hypothetical protein